MKIKCITNTLITIVEKCTTSEKYSKKDISLFLCSCCLINVIYDILNNELKINDKIIVTVSRKSHYLTSARILSLDQENNKILVLYDSTIKTRMIDLNKHQVVKYESRPVSLDGRRNLCRDCTNNVIEPGQKVIYRNLNNKQELAIGQIKTVDSPLWVTLLDGKKVRNVGICIII